MSTHFWTVESSNFAQKYIFITNLTPQDSSGSLMFIGQPLTAAKIHKHNQIHIKSQIFIYANKGTGNHSFNFIILII